MESAQGYASCGQQGYVLVDIPGCYSLHTRSAEEEVARDFICSGIPDVVAVVCDAVCLERSMGLVLQVLGLTKRVVVCVNLMDEAEKKRIRIDLHGLQERLGVPVVGTAARAGVGIREVYRAIDEMAGKQEGGTVGEWEEKNGDDGYLEPDRRKDRIFTGKWTAVPVMFLLLLGIFWLTIVGANYPSELLRTFFSFLEGKLTNGLRWLGVPETLRSLAVDGVYRVVSWIVAVMLPPMAIFFPLFTVVRASILPDIVSIGMLPSW